jgi:hypothetical protein
MTGVIFGQHVERVMPDIRNEVPIKTTLGPTLPAGPAWQEKRLMNNIKASA